MFLVIRNIFSFINSYLYLCRIKLFPTAQKENLCEKLKNANDDEKYMVCRNSIDNFFTHIAEGNRIHKYTQWDGKTIKYGGVLGKKLSFDVQFKKKTVYFEIFVVTEKFKGKCPFQSKTFENNSIWKMRNKIFFI